LEEGVPRFTGIASAADLRFITPKKEKEEEFMSPIQALFGFTVWTLLVVTVVVLYRVVRFLTGTPINSWPRGIRVASDPPVIQRLADAHANCVENLPVFAIIVLAAAYLNRMDAIATLAPYVLYARIVQTLTHMSGTGPIHVLVRATFWTIQLVLYFWMLCTLYR
jgi:uncharacterized MAPEG superfamily protein